MGWTFGPKRNRNRRLSDAARFRSGLLQGLGRQRRFPVRGSVIGLGLAALVAFGTGRLLGPVFAESAEAGPVLQEPDGPGTGEGAAGGAGTQAATADGQVAEATTPATAGAEVRAAGQGGETSTAPGGAGTGVATGSTALKAATAPVIGQGGTTSLPLALELLGRATIGEDGRLHARLPDGRTATLSIDPELQRKTVRILKDYNVPWGASVAIEPSTGRVLAIAEHAREGSGAGLAARAFAPAASIFKIVTGAALLEAGISASETVCVHGGLRRLAPAHLKDSPRDHRCVTLAEAMGHSTNAVFAKLAHRHLRPDSLREVAERLRFGTPLAVEGGAIGPSPLAIPDDDEFHFATTAAGFNTGVRLTPIHGALLAAAIGNKGMLPDARIIDAIDGIPVEGAPHARRILSEGVAKDLGEMLEKTVTTGTARAAFRERRGAALPGIRVAGKTGSLFEKDPFRDATWFVGYAPMEEPTIAVASVVVNGDKWRIRANYLARETLRSYLLGTTPYRPN